MNELDPDEVKRLEKEIWDERKALYKEALDEWWEEKFKTGGKWILITLAIVAVGIMGNAILNMAGWHK